MSSPAGHGEVSGIGRVVARVKSVLKKPGGRRRSSLLSRASRAPAGSISVPAQDAIRSVEASTSVGTVQALPTESMTTAPRQAPRLAEDHGSPNIARDEATTSTIDDAVVSTSASTPALRRILRSEIEAARVQQLMARFKIDISTADLMFGRPEEEALRVEKPIRMRVHRTCHVCAESFGSNKICRACQHRRCSECPRYPGRRADKNKDSSRSKGKERDIAGILEVDLYHGTGRDETPLTKPSKTGGQPLVRRKPKQRVRRFCCGCGGLYAPSSKTCRLCQHVRCSECPRDPAKKKKYPYGYPGDVASQHVRHYSCHLCTKIFTETLPRPSTGSTPLDSESQRAASAGESATPLAPTASNTKIGPASCPRCEHVRCDRCRPAVPRKIEPELGPEAMKTIEERMRRVRIGVSTDNGTEAATV